MKKFKWLLIFFALSSIVACKSFKGYTINGTIKNAEGVEVFLEDIASDDLTVIDTTTVHNGKFQLKNYADKGIYRLRFGQQQSIFVYINPRDQLEITADLNNITDYTIKGSKDCQSIKDFTMAIDQQLGEQDSLYAKLQRAPEAEKDSITALLNNSLKNYISYIKQYVASAENKEIAAFALNFLGPSMQQEIPYLIAITDSLHQADPKSKLINRWYTSLQQYRESISEGEGNGIAMGAMAPNIVLENPNGDTIQLKNLQGKYVLLDFWASWCGPCREENPNVVKLYKKYHPKGLEIFSVSLDKNKSPWINAIEKDGLIWKNHGSDLLGWSSKPAQDYQVESIPQTYLLNPKGEVIGKNLRGPRLEQKLQQIFADSVLTVQP